MADPRKNTSFVVVVVILGYLSMPAHCFTQDLQHYTSEISKRSFAVMDGMMDSDGIMMRFGYPVFVILTFCSSVRSLISLLAGLIPGMLPALLGLGGTFGSILGLPGTEMAQARDGEQREQRMMLDVSLKNIYLKLK